MSEPREKQVPATIHDEDSPPCLGSLLVEKLAPPEVKAGERFGYTIRITNTAGAPVQSVVLVESLISLIEIQACKPEPQSMEPHSARWVLEAIWPGESRSVQVTCVARKRLWFRSHTSIAYALG